MTYDPGRIEIRSDGDVVTGGNLVGRIAFASPADRMAAVGEHYREDGDPDEDLLDEIDDLKAKVSDLRDGIAAAAKRLLKGDPADEIRHDLDELL